ncbi:MAG: hypothetical protein JOZ52_08175 [Acidobacteria bacterium]|nr:hypothetical protein [Acidobacteriota bacterium]
MLSNHRFKFSSMMSVLTFKRRHANAKTDSTAWAQTFWGRKFIKSATLMLALLCSASIALADVKITTRSAAGGQNVTSATYIKGARQRTEGMGFTTIYQCDLKRTIQINDKTKTYLITPLSGASATSGSSSQKSGATRRKGGVITYHTINTDTGERKQMFGLTAKHIKSRMVIEASEGACNSMDMEMETDGWYVDIPGGASCSTDASANGFPVDQSDCVDEVRFQTEGVANTGYPVMTTTRIKFNTEMNIPTSESTQEVTDLSTVKLDAALFDIPAGYREVKTTQELGSPF